MTRFLMLLAAGAAPLAALAHPGTDEGGHHGFLSVMPAEAFVLLALVSTASLLAAAGLRALRARAATGGKGGR